MKTVLKILMVLLIAISFVGCHPRLYGKVKSNMYPGPERPKEDIAVIKGDGHYIYWGYFATKSMTGIHMIDGEVPEMNKTYYRYSFTSLNYHFPDADEVRVLPGPHEVVIRISKATELCGYFGCQDTSLRSRLLIFNWDTKAGHAYKVDVPIYWRKDSIIKVIDEGTKEVVESKVADQ